MFYIGVDLGQRRDFTAIAVAEVEDPRLAWVRVDERVGLRHLERVALGTPYTAVARRVEELVGQLNGHCAVAVDATGLGAPVVDLLKEARIRCELAAVMITGGERENYDRGVWHVPKRDLVGGLQALLEKRELRIAKGLRETGWLVKELVDMRSMTSQTGRTRWGADGANEHDDLVIAAALACWMARRPLDGSAA